MPPAPQWVRSAALGFGGAVAGGPDSQPVSISNRAPPSVPSRILICQPWASTNSSTIASANGIRDSENVYDMCVCVVRRYGESG